MSTLNGIGILFYNIKGPDEEGNCTAIRWVTFLYFPVIPLGRMKIERKVTDPRVFEYEIIQKLPLNFLEILRTWFLGWLVLPAVIWGPLLFCVPEFAAEVGVNLDYGAPGLTFPKVLIGLSIVWMLVAVLWVRGNHERKGLPKDWKQRIAETEKQ